MAQMASVNEIIKLITEDVKVLVRDEVELAKADLIPSAKKAGIGAGMFGAAGYFAMCGLALWGMAGGFGFGQLFGGASGGIALGFLIMGLVLFVIAGLLAFLGKTSISKAKGPQAAIDQGKGTVEDVKLAVTRANVNAQSHELELRNFDQN
ncbi:phage holin family protein [Granulicoccus phenolivorans]|uniref:phage holin family protein n=1 Tax=Granulicoccus phenolivorans TaxID=266854 RepID=UPI0004043E4B|nr:phage holin family protein [Granulicoccus phenolivorans]